MDEGLIKINRPKWTSVALFCCMGPDIGHT